MLKTSSKYSPGPGAVLGPMLADVDAPGELVKDLGVAQPGGRPHQLSRAALSGRADPEARPAPGHGAERGPRPRGGPRGPLGLKGRRAFFDEEKDTLLDASVKGDPGQGYVVSVIFRVPSGRTVRGVIPYDKVPQSARAFEESLEQEASAASFLRGFPDASGRAGGVLGLREPGERGPARAARAARP
jgi:hypothetical protein